MLISCEQCTGGGGPTVPLMISHSSWEERRFKHLFNRYMSSSRNNYNLRKRILVLVWGKPASRIGTHINTCATALLGFLLVSNYSAMEEADSETIDPQAHVWVQTSDGSIQQVDEEVAMFCPFIRRKIFLGIGSSKNDPISLPTLVDLPMLRLILDYSRFHQAPGRSNKNVEVQKDQVDSRSLDDILANILGDDEDSKAVPISKRKKENRKKKGNQKTDPSSCSTPIDESSVTAGVQKNKETDGVESGSVVDNLCNTTEMIDIDDDGIAPSDDEFDCYDPDDDLDPARMEEIDREVEEFARRLNVNWPEKMLEILYPNESAPLQLASGSGSLRKFTSGDERQK